MGGASREDGSVASVIVGRGEVQDSLGGLTGIRPGGTIDLAAKSTDTG